MSNVMPLSLTRIEAIQQRSLLTNNKQQKRLLINRVVSTKKDPQ